MQDAMTEENPQPGMDAYQFILGNLDSVPHLEALMLLWNSRPVGWTCQELASRLYISPEKVNDLVKDLVALRLVMESRGPGPKYSYFSRSEDQDNMMLLVDAAHRRDLIRISTMIHSKASSAVREFARAFRIKKERD
jgi:DNA-binding transcriptional regulator GbsR (MarR family)